MMIIRQLGSAVWLLVLMFVTFSVLDAQPNSNGKIAIPINSGWEFRQTNSGDPANAGGWVSVRGANREVARSTVNRIR